jgi:hypothetical protein
MFDRVKPCKTCPFRTDENGLRHLGYDRAVEIVDSIRDRDQTFTCHDDLGKPRREVQHCAGALIMLEAIDQPNQMMRISERIGCYDRRKLVGQDEVFDDFDDWIECQDD